MLFNYSEGGTSTAADLDPDVMTKMTIVYILGIVAFVLGSHLSSHFKRADPPGLNLAGLTWRFKFLCVITAALLIASKILLVSQGVYSEYAFTTDSMIGGVWSFSMVCSESLVLLSIVVLFSNGRHNVLWFALLTAINALNLLHGTRFFFVIGAMIFFFYLYVHRKLTYRMAIVGTGVVLFVGYVIFLLRSHVEVDNQTFSAISLLSPMMFEGIFSQLSLIGTIRHPEAWSLYGSAHHFVLDTLYFITPRFLLPAKDQLLFMDQYSDLSPMGAFSGYAQGLIYFGVFFPGFYLVVGYIAGWLQRRAKSSHFFSVMYVYFVCDFLFRLMRDGYVIPIKMLVDSMLITLCVACLELQIHPRATPAFEVSSIGSPNEHSGARRTGSVEC